MTLSFYVPWWSFAAVVGAELTVLVTAYLAGRVAGREDERDRFAQDATAPGAPRSHRRPTGLVVWLSKDSGPSPKPDPKPETAAEVAERQHRYSWPVWSHPAQGSVAAWLRGVWSRVRGLRPRRWARSRSRAVRGVLVGTGIRYLPGGKPAARLQETGAQTGRRRLSDQWRAEPGWSQ